MSTPRAAIAARPADGLARHGERVLRFLGDGRTGLALLLLAGAANAVATITPAGPEALDSPPYAALLAAVALSAVAAVAVRAPAAWREWRRPQAVPDVRGALVLDLAPRPPDAVLAALGGLGYRARLDRGSRGWSIHAVRRGWSRFAGIVSHLALVVIVIGAAIGSAFGSETTFSLLPGEQAFLDAPRPGFSSAVRLEAFEARFGPDGRPRVLDTTVTFLREGAPESREVIRVNEPGAFDGYLVHPWTYGPAARLRVTSLGGAALLDAAVPLDGERAGTPVGSVELAAGGATLGLALTDAEANQLGVSVLGDTGRVDTGRVHPGEEVRIGDLIVRLDGFEAWVTFLARRDPGLGVIFSGAAALSVTLAVAFWMPRRRVSVRPAGGELRLVLRGERFDDPGPELARLRAVLEAP